MEYLSMLEEFNRYHGRLLDAHRDFTVSSETLRRQEAEGLAAIDRFPDAGMRDPATTKAEWRAKLSLAATTALTERLGRPAETVTKTEVVQRWSDLKKAYLALDSSDHDKFGEYVRSITQIQRRLEGRPISPMGALILLAIVVFVLYQLFGL